MELVHKTFVNYIGNYDYYLEKRDSLTPIYAASSASVSAPEVPAAQAAAGSKASWQEQKEAQARERKRKNDLKKTEEQIAALEGRNAEIDKLLTHEDIYSNSVKCQELTEEKEKNEAALEELYEQWAELAE